MSDVDHIVKINGHYDIFLKLQKQRQDEQFCDVILQVQERYFPAHKPVLVAASDYFFEMFKTDMNEEHNEKIVIENVTAKAMEQILDCIYTGQFSFSDDSIPEILHAASLMQLTSLLEAVANFMQSSLNAENCCIYLKLATLFSLQDVADDINEFLLQKFCEVSDTSDFLQYDVDKIDEILASDDLIVEREMQVFDFIVNWVNKDFEERKQHFPRLFRRVRLQYLLVDYNNYIRKHELVKENLECRDIVDDAFSFYCSPTVFTAQKPRHCFAPNPDSVMLLPYGKKCQAVYNNTAKTWNNIFYEGLTEDTILKNCAVAFNHPVTVLCGGTTKSNKASRQVVRFDSVQWMEMPPMNEARCGSVSVFHDGNLYVFEGETFPVSPNSTFSEGQHNPDAQNFSKTYEMLNDFSREWDVFPTPWTPPRSYGAAQAVGDNIYLIGGYKLVADEPVADAPCKLISSDTIAFCPEDRTWNEVGPLSSARAKFSSAVLDSCIYVVGGYDNFNFLPVPNVEFMNTAENVWTRLNFRYGYFSLFPKVNCCCCVGKKLYALGSTVMFQKSTNGKKWFKESSNVPACGIIIPYASWYENQSFVKIRED